jgi:hypothetical protein
MESGGWRARSWAGRKTGRRCWWWRTRRWSCCCCARCWRTPGCTSRRLPTPPPPSPRSTARRPRWRCSSPISTSAPEPTASPCGRGPSPPPGPAGRLRDRQPRPPGRDRPRAERPGPRQAVRRPRPRRRRARHGPGRRGGLHGRDAGALLTRSAARPGARSGDRPMEVAAPRNCAPRRGGARPVRARARASTTRNPSPVEIGRARGRRRWCGSRPSRGGRCRWTGR